MNTDVDQQELDNSPQYWIAVWILPVFALGFAFAAAGLATLDLIAVHWPPRFGAACVATGILCENYLFRPRYEYKAGWFIPVSPPARSTLRYNWEQAIVMPQVVFGTGLWGFGDLFY